MIRVGPAGWSYPDWEGVVYPSPHPARFDPLDHARYVKMAKASLAECQAYLQSPQAKRNAERIRRQRAARRSLN